MVCVTKYTIAECGKQANQIPTSAVRQEETLCLHDFWSRRLSEERATIDGERREREGATRRVALHIDEHEADALMSLLLHAIENPSAPEAMMDHLLRLLAEAQREFARPAASPSADIVPVVLIPGPAAKEL